jgi:regulator of chromosome condensation
MKDITANDEDDDSDSDDDSEDSGLNPSEADPRQIDPKYFPDGTRFASLFAGDSTTFALTTTGLVFGWGTFRVSHLQMSCD